MKRGRELLLVLGAVFSVNVVSALSGGYSRLSFGDFLNEVTNTVGPSTIFLGAIFIIAFAILYKIMQKVFGENSSSAGVVSFVMSFVLIYGVNRAGFDFEGVFNYLGYSSGTAYAIFSVLVAMGIVFTIYKIGFGKALMIIGITIITITTFTEWIYEKGISLIAGIFIFLVGLGLWRRKAKRERQRAAQYAGMPPRYGGFRRGWQRSRDSWNAGRTARERYRRWQERKQERAKKWEEVEKAQQEKWELISKTSAKGAKKIGKFAKDKYDWEKEKRQAKWFRDKAIAGAEFGAKGARRAGGFVKDNVEKGLEKIKKKKEDYNLGKKEKLFRKLQGLNKKINNFNKEISKLDKSKSLNYINNLTWKRDKLSKRAEKIKHKLKALGYPI